MLIINYWYNYFFIIMINKSYPCYTHMHMIGYVWDGEDQRMEALWLIHISRVFSSGV